jgi:hypothetical protein
MISNISSFAIVLALLPMGALAKDFDKGMAACQSDDYTTALQEWLPLSACHSVVKGKKKSSQWLLR